MNPDDELSQILHAFDAMDPDVRVEVLAAIYSRYCPECGLPQDQCACEALNENYAHVEIDGDLDLVGHEDLDEPVDEE